MERIPMQQAALRVQSVPVKSLTSSSTTSRRWEREVFIVPSLHGVEEVAINLIGGAPKHNILCSHLNKWNKWS